MPCIIAASSSILIVGTGRTSPPSCFIASVSGPSMIEHNRRKFSGSRPLIHSILRASSLPTSWSRASTTATTRVLLQAMNNSSTKWSLRSRNFVMSSLSSSNTNISERREIKYRSMFSARLERDDIPQLNGSSRH